MLFHSPILDADDIPLVKWQEMKNYDRSRIICLDTETTGLDGTDEVLELAIVDGTGRILFDHRFKPDHVLCWPEAEAIHHISPEDLAEEKPLAFYYEELLEIFSKARIIMGYNIRYDLRMLRQSGIDFPNVLPGRTVGVLDIMPLAAPILNEPGRYKKYKWQKLTAVADYYHYKWTGTAHGAMADTMATLFIYEKILEENLK